MTAQTTSMQYVWCVRDAYKLGPWVERFELVRRTATGATVRDHGRERFLRENQQTRLFYDEAVLGAWLYSRTKELRAALSEGCWPITEMRSTLPMAFDKGGPHSGDLFLAGRVKLVEAENQE